MASKSKYSGMDLRQIRAVNGVGRPPTGSTGGLTIEKLQWMRRIWLSEEVSLMPDPGDRHAAL